MNCGDCKNTGKQICTVCCTYQGGVPDRWEPKPTTNADRIRAMSDEELADEILSWFNWLNAVEWNDKRILDWLRQEVSEWTALSIPGFFIG